MNKNVTSHELIIEACKRITKNNGLNAINIRSVATECNVSVGSIYNYFSNKDILVLDTIDYIWDEVLHEKTKTCDEDDLRATVKWIFDRIAFGHRKYPEFFSAHIFAVTDKNKEYGRRIMARYVSRIRSYMVKAIETDPRIPEAAFDDKFTKNALADFIITMMMNSIMQKRFDSDTFLEILERAVFQR